MGPRFREDDGLEFNETISDASVLMRGVGFANGGIDGIEASEDTPARFSLTGSDERLGSGLTFEHFKKPKYPNIRPDPLDTQPT